MFLTVTTEDDNIIPVTIDAQEDISLLHGILEAESGISSREQSLIRNGRELPASTSLAASGIQDGDLLLLRRRQPGVDMVARNPDGTLQHPQAFMDAFSSRPEGLAELPPPVAAAIRNRDINALQNLLRQATQQQVAARQAEEALWAADEFDPEAQAQIAQRIQQQAIDDNYQAAFEHSPEVFSQVTMLYVSMEVNGVAVKAFVDSGAQTSIMSQACAERCHILRLLDRRFRGVAHGVGSGAIVGRIHTVPTKVGRHFLPMAITVLEADNMDFLFGLDMLKRYQCSIDLKAGVLRFGSLEPEAVLPFLSEHELPKSLLFPPGGESAAMSPTEAAGAAAAARAASAPGQPIGGSPRTSAGRAAGPPGQQPGETLQSSAAGSAPGPIAEAGTQPDAAMMAKVQRLEALGFPRQQCLEVLSACNGNEDQAAALLFEM